MPATITTRELFSLAVSEDSLKDEVKLRIKAGAIRSWYERQGDGYTLFTEWNVIGEQ
jgi:hypothetical protein